MKTVEMPSCLLTTRVENLQAEILELGRKLPVPVVLGTRDHPEMP